MEPPNIQGYEILTEVGSGSAGVVYEAKREDGTICAVKAFETMSSNIALLTRRVNRVLDGGAQDITLPIQAASLESRPPCVIMPFMAERIDGGAEQFKPRTLQIFFEDYQANEFSWPFILKLANRLATLHTVKVAHGNLKPGNIFIEEAGVPLLADYASGLMPGVHRMSYTDALLYAPPEQLRHPEGYNDEAGYRWDVYAFGVLAYRLLTGQFPRCHEIFESVSPAPGTQDRFEIEADYEGIAEGLEENESFGWPTKPKSDEDARRREMINFCLCLDPMGRPGDMREVSRYFESVDIDLAVEKENLRLLKSERSARRKKKSLAGLLGLVSFGAAGLGGFLLHTQKENQRAESQIQQDFDDYRETAEELVVELSLERDQSIAGEMKATQSKVELQNILSKQQGQTDLALASAYETNETLMNWALEEGIENLPVLEGRKERLGLLYDHLNARLKTIASEPGLSEQTVLLELRKAELALAQGEIAKGAVQLRKVIDSGRMPEELLARARMRLLLVTAKLTPSELEPLLAPTEAAVKAVWGEEEALMLRASAAINLAKGEMWTARGDGAQALTSYQASLSDYQKLLGIYPDNPAISLLMGSRYLSAAAAAEGAGSFENSAKLRAKAAEAFTQLAKRQSKPAPELQFQIASATAARAVSQWQQGDTFGAEKLAREGVAKLSILKTKMPGDFRVIVDLAAQQGIIATALRDEGRPDEARMILTESIKNVEEGLVSRPKHWAGRYLLASLKWQLSGLLGQQGEGDSELEMGAAAYEELKSLLASNMIRPEPSEVRKSLAYLCGDLGHSADLREKRALGVKYLEESKRYWQELARDEGDKVEFRRGYHWANDRLSEMGVK